MGADEQLGGYGRHRAAFEREGAEGVLRELARDIDRLPHRNLGRDDRCIADWGREARHPFLDEGVMRTLAALPLAAKVDFGLPRGGGDKLVLRECARRMGLPRAAALPKRAIQFGSRVAKATGAGRRRGGDVQL